jgi:exonuclease III
LLGMNVNGLNDPKVVGKLLRQAKQLRVDVIFLQEHNLTRLKARDFEFLVGKKGWKAAISTAGLTPRSSRGGTAVLVREDIPGLTEFHIDVDRNRGDSLKGRLSSVTLEVDGKTLNLGSVYVPVIPSERKQFIIDCVKSPSINKHSILQGDWNCVEEVSVDAQYLDGSPPGDYTKIFTAGC